MASIQQHFANGRTACSQEFVQQPPLFEHTRAASMDEMSLGDVAGEGRPVYEQHMMAVTREQHRCWCTRTPCSYNNRIVHHKPPYHLNLTDLYVIGFLRLIIACFNPGLPYSSPIAASAFLANLKSQ